MSDEYGQPIAGAPQTWLKGEASFDGTWITLDLRSAEEYLPYADRDLPFELAAVQSPENAIGFVRKYGLLRHGPSASEHRELLSEWEREIVELKLAINLYRGLLGIQSGDHGAEDQVRTLLEIDTSEPVEKLAEEASISVAYLVAKGLDGVEVSMTTEAGWEGGDPSSFLFMAKADTLLGYAYFHLSAVIVPRTPLRACPDCGRNFPVRHHNQKYCSTTCSNRTRRRKAANKPEKGMS